MEVMMDSEKRQKKLQEDSYKLLAKRIEKLSQGQSKEIAQAKGMLSYIQKLIKKIEEFKEEYLQEVISKLIREYEENYCKLLGAKYKNVHKFLAKPLTNICLQNYVDNKTLNELKERKEKLETLKKTRLEELHNYTQKRIDLGGDIYASLAKENTSFVKEMPQRVALAIWQISANDLAFMLMKHILELKNIDNADAENRGNTRQTFGAQIGEEVHHRIAWRFFNKIEKVERSEIKSYLRDYINGNFSKMNQLFNTLWRPEVELEVGQKLIELAIEVGILKEYNKVNDDKGFNYLKFDSEFLKKMKKSDQNIAHTASMIYKPMVIEPLDWEGMYGGGFLPDEVKGESRFDLSLIKASNRTDRKVFCSKKVPQEILDGINHLQKTAFTINKKMLEVLEDYHNDIYYLNKENRVDFAYYRILKELLVSKTYKLSKEDIYEHFKRTNFIRLNKEGELSQSDKRRIKKAINASKEHQDIEKLKLDTSLYYEIAKYKQGFDTIVKIAKEMQEEEKFYFVWRMDFRGRIYPQQTLLHPQAGDLPKSLLLFSEQKQLDSKALEWFFIHGANCYGEVDKEPFERRIKWVKDNHDNIIDAAKNYRESSFWKQAGDPWKFLAFCFEYARYTDAPKIFKTGLPIAIDGSNNGFQHISVLLRDKEGATSVNVLPDYDSNGNLIVADLYAKVAGVLREKMQKEYQVFLDNKETLEEQKGFFYRKEKEFILEPSYYLEPLIKFLEGIEPSDLKPSQFYTTYLREQIEEIKWHKVLDKKDKEAIFTLCENKEREIRKEFEDDLEEVKETMIDDFKNLVTKAERRLDKGKLTYDNKGKVCSQKKELVLDHRCVYQKFFDYGLIKRGFVKSPVMTESYGSGTQGKAQNLLEEIESYGILSELKEKERYIVALEITKLLENSLSEVSNSPQKYKKWMKDYAKEVTKEKKAIKWKTPLGLEVEQVEYTSKKVKVAIGGGRKVEFRVYTDKIDKTGHQNGFPPNYIHSLDATHLFMTVNKLKKKGICDIVTVHDSFATHARDVDKLSKSLREAFVELHKKELLADLVDFFEKEFKLKPKEIPYVDKESFKLEEVLKSDYFFA